MSSAPLASASCVSKSNNVCRALRCARSVSTRPLASAALSPRRSRSMALVNSSERSWYKARAWSISRAEAASGDDGITHSDWEIKKADASASALPTSLSVPSFYRRARRKSRTFALRAPIAMRGRVRSFAISPRSAHAREAFWRKRAHLCHPPRNTAPLFQPGLEPPRSPPSPGSRSA